MKMPAGRAFFIGINLIGQFKYLISLFSDKDFVRRTILTLLEPVDFLMGKIEESLSVI